MTIYRVPGAALAVAAAFALASAARAPLTVQRSSDALLRLAWSARPERIEQCRQQTEEELANIPKHMRQPVACEGVAAEYRLQVRIDGTLVTERVVRGGGLRRDRRLYVFEELPVQPGESEIEVRLDRIEIEDVRDADGVKDGREVPPHLVFAERVRFQPREVVLVTYDPGERVLRAVGK